MPTIPVPAPPKSAFNKNRPVSDLLQHQLKHFRHIEAALPNELHSNMTARDLHTENGAARYIAHITEALKSLHGVSTPAAAPIPIRRRRDAARTFDIAAAATTPGRRSKLSDPRNRDATHGSVAAAPLPTEPVAPTAKKSSGKTGGPTPDRTSPVTAPKAPSKHRSRGRKS